MEHLQKLYATISRRHGAGRSAATDHAQDGPSAGRQPVAGTATDMGTSPTELEQLPREPESRAHLRQMRFLGNASDDDSTINPRKLPKLALLGLAGSPAGSAKDSTATIVGARLRFQSTTTLLDKFTLLPPELQLKILAYLDFGDIERLRRSCRFFRASVTPSLVRSLLAGEFQREVRFTCYLCLKRYDHGACLVSTDRHDARYPLSSRCVECVWKTKDFDVGRKYLMGSDVAVYVCRWCGRPVTTHPAWNQPEFHKRCFKRYTRAVFLYYLIGLAQWVLVFIGSGLVWHYFRHDLAVIGITVASFMCTLWLFCLNAVRGTLMRTYHFALLMEALIFAAWLAPAIKLFNIGSGREPHRMTAYEVATLVFVFFNLLFRGINIIGNTILMFEYKLWRHKKPDMSPARSAWIHAIEVFIFFAEPQCIEQEYPPKWWFRRRRPAIVMETDHDLQPPEVVGVAPGEQQPGVGPYQLDTDHNMLPVP